MAEELSDGDRLFDEAVDLLIRLRNDPGNPVAVEMAGRWRQRSPEHECAWAEALEIHGLTGKVLADERKAAGRPGTLSRRTLMIGGLVTGAAAVTGAATVPGFLVRAQANHMTSTAEVRRVPLPDGSVMTLGPDSALALRLTQETRHVELLKGMAFFDVAADRDRPFSVDVAGVRVKALGTAFDVSGDASFVTVSVEHGAVAVQLPSSAGQSDYRLAAGEWVMFDASDRSTASGSREVAQFASWRDGLIVAEKEPISAIVARIARWHEGRVVIATPGLGRERVSGVFDLRNPTTALEAVVHPYGGKVRHISRYLTVVSPI